MRRARPVCLLLRQVLENYALSLKHGHKLIMQSLPRLLTLWYDFGKQQIQQPSKGVMRHPIPFLAPPSSSLSFFLPPFPACPSPPLFLQPPLPPPLLSPTLPPALLSPSLSSVPSAFSTCFTSLSSAPTPFRPSFPPAPPSSPYSAPPLPCPPPHPPPAPFLSPHPC